jgi:hypothetical protein
MTNCSHCLRLEGRTASTRTQHGAATLLICLALVVACTALAISLAHTTTLERRMARNSLLANQAQEAAIAGLNFGSAWLKRQRPDWLVVAGGREVAAPADNPPAMHSRASDSFAVNLTFERDPLWQGYILVRATASPASAVEIEARASQYVRPTSIFTVAGETAPPLVVDGCADLSGANDLYPANADTADAGAVVASSDLVACVQAGGASLHGGTLQGEAFAAGELWDYLFTVDRIELETLAAEQAALGLPAEERDYWWAGMDDLSAGEWRQSLGSLERPVLLVIPAELGCPRFSGGARIIGLVFIEADCTGAPGWGDVEIYGGLAVGGSFDALGPSSRLAHIGQLPGGPARIELPVLEVTQLAGSWKDF